MDEAMKITMSGTVVFIKTNLGSKSESSLPHLYRGKDEPMLPLYVEGDNPFENASLAACDGQSVTLVGMMSRGKFVIEKISKN